MGYLEKVYYFAGVSLFNLDMPVCCTVLWLRLEALSDCSIPKNVVKALQTHCL